MRKLTVYLKKEQRKDTFTKKSVDETETITNMTQTVRKVFLKIRDQLEDPNHPLC